jgi:hypothetical protein
MVTVTGVLTTPLGALESGRGGFVQDASGGIALYLDTTVVAVWPAGTTVMVAGEIASRFGQRTLRISEADLGRGADASLPAVQPIETGAAGETDEGRRVEVNGTVIASPDELTDGLGITVDDGSGPVRAVIGPAALDGRTITTGVFATVRGPLGQRDSSGTGTAGYRVHATVAGELEIVEPSPSPTPTLSPTPTPSPTVGPPSPTPTPITTPGPTPIATPSPSPTPTSMPTPISIAAARAMPIGSRVTTAGVVIAEAGRMGSPSLIAIGDVTGGIVIHGAGDAPTYQRGTRLIVTGKLAAPYGQLEVKPGATDVQALGTGSQPEPIALDDLVSEAVEGRLATVTGRLDAKPTKSSSGDVTFVLVRDDGAATKVFADSSSRVAAATLTVGATYRVTGVVGQRASGSGALDGYRICLRGAGDITRLTAAPGATPRPTASAKASGSPGGPPVVTIAAALRIDDRDVRIDGIVTAPATLLDATGRRIVVQDASAAVELLLPTGTAAPPVGTRIRATGRMGVAYGAPRLRADTLDVLPDGTSSPRPTVLHTPPGAAHEWRLVTITGRVASVHKLGDRWRAEITVGGKGAVVVGQPGAGIPSTTLVEGRMASVTGIARRPYPNASDRRYAVTPRFPADVRPVGGASGGGPTASGSSDGPSAPGESQDAASSDPIPDAPDVDLDELGGHIGALIRVGGLVVDLEPNGFTLDDGTAIGRIELRGVVLDSLPLIEPDDALNAVGRVEAAAGGPIVVVDDAGRLILSGDPVAATGSTMPSADPSIAPASSADGASHGRFAGLSGPPGGFDGSIAGMATLLAVSAVTLAVTLLRRRHGRRLMAARVADRLAALAGAPGPADGVPSTPASPSRSAERGSSTLGSA